MENLFLNFVLSKKLVKYQKAKKAIVLAIQWNHAILVVIQIKFEIRLTPSRDFYRP